MFVIYTLSTFSDVLHCSQILYDIPNLKANYTIFTVKKLQPIWRETYMKADVFTLKTLKASYVFLMYFSYFSHVKQTLNYVDQFAYSKNCMKTNGFF